MHVHVIEDAGARRLAEVDPHVHAVRRVGLGQRDLATRRVSSISSQSSSGVAARQRGDVPVRDHHQVAVVVGKEIEDDEAGRAAKTISDRIDLQGAAEHAAVLDGAGHVGSRQGLQR